MTLSACTCGDPRAYATCPTHGEYIRAFIAQAIREQPEAVEQLRNVEYCMAIEAELERATR